MFSASSCLQYKSSDLLKSQISAKQFMFYPRMKCYWSENISHQWNLKADGTRVTGHIKSGFVPQSTGVKNCIIPI